MDDKTLSPYGRPGVGADLLPANVSRPWMTQMLGLVRRLGSAHDLAEMLQMICEGVVETLEFGAAALNVTLPGGDLRCEAVCGPPDLAATILHTVSSRSVWEEVMARSDRVGSLLFLPGDRWPDLDSALPTWTPDIAESDAPDAWRASDGMFVPLYDRHRALLGILSVDDPASGLRPGLEQRTLLELFAAEAGNALNDALERAELADSEVVYRRVFDEATAPMLVADSSLGVLRANAAFGLLAALDPGTLAGTDLGTLLPPDDVAGLVAACHSVTAEGAEAITIEHRLVRVDRRVRWVRSTVSRIDTVRAGPRLVLRTEDVTEDRKTLEELRRLADHDALTGLPNRRTARRRLEHLVGEGLGDGGDGRKVAVLYCDLDGFKAVNDRLGHAAGDELLALVASRLSRIIRPPDLLCREGGDEFVVIATMAADELPGLIAQRCVDALMAPFALRSGPASVSLSIGVAVAGRSGVTAAGLLRDADAALYRAKAAGRARWALAGDGVA